MASQEQWDSVDSIFLRKRWSDDRPVEGNVAEDIWWLKSMLYWRRIAWHKPVMTVLLTTDFLISHKDHVRKRLRNVQFLWFLSAVIHFLVDSQMSWSNDQKTYHSPLYCWRPGQDERAYESTEALWFLIFHWIFHLRVCLWHHSRKHRLGKNSTSVTKFGLQRG